MALAVSAMALLAGCGSSSTVTLQAHSPSPSSSASPSATASGGGGGSSFTFPSPPPGTAAAVAPANFSCTAQPHSGEQLALVRLRGVAGIVVRDITDVGHPVSRCTFASGQGFKFYDAIHVSYIVLKSGDQGAPGALFLANLQTGATSLVRAWSYTGFAGVVYAWSPDGHALTYIDSASSAATWHMLSASGDRVLLNLGQVPARGWSADNDDVMVGFSADGRYVAAEQTFSASTSSTPAIQVNRVSDASIAYSRTDGTMAVWAGTGSRLLFRTGVGVQAWDPDGGVTTVKSGTTWIHPMASPDGARMAFSVLNAQQNHIGLVLDLTSGATHSLSPNARVGAAFLNAALVWYAGETPCTTASPCSLGGPPLSGQTYIYDLGSDVETGSIDTAFYDAWPHVTGQS